MIKVLGNRKMEIHQDTFISRSSNIIGGVTIGKESSIWPGAVLRAETEDIIIGECCNVQDNVTIHVDEGWPCILGDYVSIGHNAVVHSCKIGDNTMIGMGSIILTGAKIGKNSLIAAGALVTENASIPPGSLVVGMPGKVVRELTEEEIFNTKNSAIEYKHMWKTYYKTDK